MITGDGQCQDPAWLSLLCGLGDLPRKDALPVKDSHVQKSGSQLHMLEQLSKPRGQSLGPKGRHQGTPHTSKVQTGLLGNRGCPLPTAQR